MTNDQWAKVVDAAVTLFLAVATLLTALIGSYLRKHFAAKDIETAATIVSTAVAAAEQVMSATATGAEKKSAAILGADNLLDKAGISLSSSQLSTMIEGAVGAMNQTPAVIAPIVVTPPPPP